jgi:hypothetical protein
MERGFQWIANHDQSIIPRQAEEILKEKRFPLGQKNHQVDDVLRDIGLFENRFYIRFGNHISRQIHENTGDRRQKSVARRDSEAHSSGAGLLPIPRRRPRCAFALWESAQRLAAQYVRHHARHPW